jgi:hypothetical protein
MKKDITERYRVICKCGLHNGLNNRIGIFTGIEHPDGLKVLRFRQKGPPYPTCRGYTHGIYPNELERVNSVSGAFIRNPTNGLQ